MPDPFSLITGALNTGASYFSSGLNYFWNRQALQSQQDYERQMYEQQKQDSLDFYKMQLSDQQAMLQDERDYNSPAAQSARLKAAGINPQLQGVSNSPTAAGTVPSANVPKQNSFNFASFVPQLAMSLEPLMQAFSMSEDIRGKQLDNKLKESEIADQVLSGLLTPREIDMITNGIPEIANLTSDEIEELRSMGLDLKNIITEPGRSNARYADAIISRIRRSYEDYGFSSRSARRYAKMAYERVRNRGRLASESGSNADYLDSLFRSTNTRSRVGFNMSGNASDMLADLYSLLFETQKKESGWRQREIGYNDKVMNRSALEQDSYAGFWKIINKGIHSDKWQERVGAYLALGLLTALSRVSGSASVSRSFVSK